MIYNSNDTNVFLVIPHVSLVGGMVGPVQNEKNEFPARLTPTGLHYGGEPFNGQVQNLWGGACYSRA